MTMKFYKIKESVLKHDFSNMFDGCDVNTRFTEEQVAVDARNFEMDVPEYVGCYLEETEPVVPDRKMLETYQITLTSDELFDLIQFMAYERKDYQQCSQDDRDKAEHLFHVLVKQSVESQINSME